MYLCSWKEKGDELHTWKGYNFSILDELKEQDLIDFSNTAKSLYFTMEGEESKAIGGKIPEDINDVG
jgi:hypothetical protein